ncbi:VOC family protein [uncultured Microbacterium sp.]|uniref:VOC family protein n=1 Tax=uncultured Microbacterium sp. TaxID=191216 RepID=UPI0025D0E55C|nr:VOC family protein [uncultured Microbacterium sp.]
MPLFDHLGLTVSDLDRAFSQWNPVLTALGCETEGGELEGGVAWWRDGETELILYRARIDDEDPHRPETHRHGRVGWQHLAFAVDSREEVDRLHAIATSAGWTTVRDPKVYPRFSERYYASFVEDDDGIRLEFMHNPPREKPAD